MRTLAQIPDIAPQARRRLWAAYGVILDCTRRAQDEGTIDGETQRESSSEVSTPVRRSGAQEEE